MLACKWQRVFDIGLEIHCGLDIWQADLLYVTFYYTHRISDVLDHTSMAGSHHSSLGSYAFLSNDVRKDYSFIHDPRSLSRT